MEDYRLNLEKTKYSILCVDDDEDILYLCKRYLERSGEFLVDTILSAEKALISKSFLKYNAIISDYEMPGINGIEFLKEIRKIYYDLPFILFTGLERDKVLIDAINNGADFYLQKGGDPKTLFFDLSHKIKQAIKRISAEKRLKIVESQNFDYINTIRDPTYAINRQGEVIAWNHAIEEMTGIYSEEIIGRGNRAYSVALNKNHYPLLIDLIDMPDEKIKKFYPNFYRDGNTIISESDYCISPKNHIKAQLTSYPIFNRFDEYIGSVETIRDITDFFTIKSNLKKNDEILRIIMTHSSNIYIIISKTLEILFISPKVESLSGFLMEEIHGPICNYVHPDDLSKVTIILESIINKPDLSEISEFRTLKRDGSYMNLEGYAINCLDNPVIQGILVIAWDISSKKKIEDKFSRKLNIFKNIVNSSKALFAIFNPEGDLLYANEIFYIYFNHEYNAGVNISIKNLFKTDWDNEWIKIINLLKYNDNKTTYELNIFKNDQEFILSTLFFLIQDGDSQLIGFFGIDITERKIVKNRLDELINQNRALEETLTKKNEEISKLLELKNELVNGIAHELRTPLTPLTVLIPLLSVEEDKHARMEIIKVIKRNILCISNIVNKILDLARQGTMYKIEDLVPVNILILMNNLVNIYKQNIQDKEISIIFDIPKNTCLITYYPHLYSILENILSNAIKYSHKKGKIYIIGHEAADIITLNIIDEGLGLTKDELPLIFNPFYKGDVSRHERMSPGLGLSITQQLLQTIGGKILVDSEGKGKGTKVTLFFSKPDMSQSS